MNSAEAISAIDTWHQERDAALRQQAKMGNSNGKQKIRTKYWFTEPENIQEECLFCRIARGKTKPILLNAKYPSPPRPETGIRETELLAQDGEFTAFYDMDPGARVHFLVIPNRHVKNCWDSRLSPSDLERMIAFGDRVVERHFQDEVARRKREIVDRQAADGERGGAEEGEWHASEAVHRFFIRPPFNSVHHAHLHVMVLPFRRDVGFFRRTGFENDRFHVTPAEWREWRGGEGGRDGAWGGGVAKL